MSRAEWVSRTRGRTPFADMLSRAQLGVDVGGVGALAIITGANCSGKSVYLKMVGLLPVMAQIGCFVPAEKAVIGIVDRVFTRIHGEESIAANQSTFAVDVQQLSRMLRHATPRSLLLIDEFGKGTSSLGMWRASACRPCRVPPSLGPPTSREACRRRSAAGSQHSSPPARCGAAWIGRRNHTRAAHGARAAV